LRRRVPWLLVNLMTAFLAALTVNAFQDTIGKVALLAVFMPVVAGHGLPGQLAIGGRVGEALDACRLAAPSPVAAVLAAGLGELSEVPAPNPHWVATPALDRALAAAAGSMARATGRQIQRLEQYLGILGTLGNIAPFIGLFGTVLGIMDAFAAIGRTGSGGFATVSTGIYKALAATAAGLFVAIPAVMAYNYLLGRVRQFTLEMDHAASALAEAVRKRAA